MLAEKERLHFGRVASVSSASGAIQDVTESVAQTVHTQMLKLHQAHRQRHESGKTVSLGLVRFANINQSPDCHSFTRRCLHSLLCLPLPTSAGGAFRY